MSGLEKLISIQEAAPYFGLAPATLKKKLQGESPLLAHYRIGGGSAKLKVSDIIQYLESCKKEAVKPMMGKKGGRR